MLEKMISGRDNIVGRPTRRVGSHWTNVASPMPTARLDVAWWDSYRPHLEREFHQDEIVVRASTVTCLDGEPQ
jgi:hypothetical protein